MGNKPPTPANSNSSDSDVPEKEKILHRYQRANLIMPTLGLVSIVAVAVSSATFGMIDFTRDILKPGTWVGRDDHDELKKRIAALQAQLDEQKRNEKNFRQVADANYKRASGQLSELRELVGKQKAVFDPDELEKVAEVAKWLVANHSEAVQAAWSEYSAGAFGEACRKLLTAIEGGRRADALLSLRYAWYLMGQGFTALGQAATLDGPKLLVK